MGRRSRARLKVPLRREALWVLSERTPAGVGSHHGALRRDGEDRNAGSLTAKSSEPRAATPYSAAQCNKFAMIHIRRFGSEVARKCSASRVFGDKWAILGRERGKKTRGDAPGRRCRRILACASPRRSWPGACRSSSARPALPIGCRQEAPLAPAMAAKVAEIAEVKGLPRRRHHRRRDRVCGDHVDPGERETDLPRRDLDDRGAGAGGRGP